MSLRKLNLHYIKESIALVESAGCHVVWVTDRWGYWQRDIAKWCPEDLQELVSICSYADFIEDGLPRNTGMVLVDGDVPLTGEFRLRYAKEGIHHSRLLEPIPTLDTDNGGTDPKWWSKVVCPMTGKDLPY